MKLRIPVVFLITLALVLIITTSVRVSAQTYTGYTIQVNSDGSATWTIKQVTGLSVTTDTLAIFQDRVTDLANRAASQTSRTMSIDNDSLQMSTAKLTENSKTTQYIFTWWNFSRTSNSGIYVGDVFAVPNIFNQLYGDGALQITCPENYAVESVTPPADQSDVSEHTLRWFGTQFFVTEKPSIIFHLQQHADTNSNQLSAFIAAGLAITAVGIVSGLLFVKSRKNHKNKDATVTTRFLFETEEEKILRVLRLTGGSAYQSTIIEQCKFSKTKTSELLSALEKKGFVRRVKKGRDKIVSLTEEEKS